MAEIKDYIFWDTSKTIEERLDDLLAQLTCEEKLHCLGTGNPAIERLGIPAFYVGGEGAHGLQMRHDQSFDKGEPQPTTIFPAPIGMSATWDPALLQQVGDAVGKEARAAYEKEGRRGGLCLWAPTVDMERDPRWGRTEEAYGEDPYLTGKMASAYVRGMRGEDPHRIQCAATLKHFYANNVEEGRVWKSSSIDPRNKYEYYLEPFRRVVTEGGAEAIMTSYNEINGVPAILNPEVQRIAKEQWGVRHVVCDGGDMKQTVDCHRYFGSHTETIAAGLKAGVDCFTDDIEAVVEGAREALALGMITMDDVDRALRCHFGTLFRLGVFDEAADAADVSKDGLNLPAYQSLSRQVTSESIVLLKNELVKGKLPFGQESLPERRLLPLNAKAYETQKTLAVIGPLADEWFLDWYAGIPPYRVTPLEGIRNAVPGADGKHIQYESGLSQVKFVCGDRYLGFPEDGETLGLVDASQAETFELALWDDEQMTIRAVSKGKYLTVQDGTDEHKNYAPGVVTATADAAFGWFVKETFLAQIPPRGLHETKDPEKGISLSVGKQFMTMLREGESVILHAWNGGRLYLDEQGRVRCREENGFVEEGEICKIKSFTDTDGRTVDVGAAWKEHGREGVYETVRGQKYRTMPAIRPILVKDGAASAAKAAAEADTVLFVGGAHPMITCKEERDRKDISVPPYQRELLQTVFSKNTSTILIWISSVPYALTWEKEQIPAILTMAGSGMELGNGLADILFGRQAPAGRLNMTWYQSTAQLPPMDEYDVIQGERTYQYFRGEPLYPFGHGLTYSTIRVSDMKAEAHLEGAHPKIHVECLIKNEERTETDLPPQDEVVQLYFTKKNATVKRPLQTLVGFRREHQLKSQEERTVAFEVPLEDLEYYDTIQQRKLLEPGIYEFRIGLSSQDILCTAQLDLEGEQRGVRDGGAWQPADHYDCSRNGYLWEGHMGYTSVVHHVEAHHSEELVEKVGGLWQNINEVTRGMQAQKPQDDRLVLTYDRVKVPKGARALVIDADAASDAMVDVWLEKVHLATYTVPDLEDLSGVENQAGWAAAQVGGVLPHGRIFRQLEIPLEVSVAEERDDLKNQQEDVAGNAGTDTLQSEKFAGALKLFCQGEIRICRWRFV